MGWVTLTTRQQVSSLNINDLELEDITLSKRLRIEQNQYSYDQTLTQNDKDLELKEAKEEYSNVYDVRPKREDYEDNNSYLQEYNEWKTDFDVATVNYESETTTINNKYDILLNNLEDETTSKQESIENEQTTVEAQLSSIRQEKETITSQIKSDVDIQKIKFGG